MEEGERMSSIGGRYIGIPCGGEKMPMFAKKGNDIDEAQKEAYRKEGDRRTIKRIVDSLVSRSNCPYQKCPDKYVSRSDDLCSECWLQYFTS
jgi:hypothetical protein